MCLKNTIRKLKAPQMKTSSPKLWHYCTYFENLLSYTTRFPSYCYCMRYMLDPIFNCIKIHSESVLFLLSQVGFCVELPYTRDRPCPRHPTERERGLVHLSEVSTAGNPSTCVRAEARIKPGSHPAYAVSFG